MKRFWRKPESPAKIPCWNKEKWQWLTGLNNVRLRLRLRIKWQEKPGGNLTKIACYLRKEPEQKCHLFTQGIGFRLSPSHIDRASWKKIFFPPINPIAPPHNCLEAELLALFISFHCELGHTGSVGVSESAGPKEQQCERPAAFSSLPYSQGGCQVPRMKGILPFLVNAPPITSPAAQSSDLHFSSCP